MKGISGLALAPLGWHMQVELARNEWHLGSILGISNSSGRQAKARNEWRFGLVLGIPEWLDSQAKTRNEVIWGWQPWHVELHKLWVS